MEYLVELKTAWMHADIFKTTSCERFCTEVTLNLHLRTLVFYVVVKTFHCFDGLITSVAYDLKALTFVQYMLVQVCLKNMLKVLILLTSMTHFYLSKHLLHKFVLNISK
jgi:hypothetical protein